MQYIINNIPCTDSDQYIYMTLTTIGGNGFKVFI